MENMDICNFEKASHFKTYYPNFNLRYFLSNLNKRKMVNKELKKEINFKHISQGKIIFL